MALNVESREIVVPGQVLYEGEDFTPGDGTFLKEGTIRSKYVGSVEVRKDDSIRVIPRRNSYKPRKGDSVIGYIERVSSSNWGVELNCPYQGFLHMNDAIDEYVDRDEDDIADWYDLGDVIVVKITNVTKSMDINLSMQDRNCRKLEGGRVITVSPAKVPRVIGRGGTMVDMIKDATDSHIIIGQNGRVWLDGGDMDLAVKAIRKVAREAHTQGLTEEMERWLREQRGDK